MQRSILIADDDPHVADGLTGLLAAAGYRARRAGDGAAALFEIQRDPPDVVLAEVTLPRLDGVTLMRRLRSQGTCIPMVLLSAEFDYVDVPGVPFLHKPFNADEVLQAITHALARRRLTAA